MVERDYRIDNIKAILIFLVVFGHLLECFSGTKKYWIYIVIYSFHMPVFAYTTGYFAKADRPEKLVRRILCPYIIFQIMYLTFQRLCLRQENSFQFTTPYWILWYLVAAFFWTLLMPMISNSGFGRRRVLAVSFIIALAVGFENTVGYYMSLSRTLVLLPFFILGCYHSFDKLKRTGDVVCAGGVILGSSMLVFWKYINQIQSRWFYHSFPYAAGEYSVWIRLGILMLACIWIALLTVLVPNKKIKVISAWGKRTMPIFLMHGFIVRWIAYKQWFKGTEIQNLALAVFIASVICFVLGNEKWEKNFSL